MSWFFGHIGSNLTAFQKIFSEKTSLNISTYLEDDFCLIYDDTKNCAHNLNSVLAGKNKFFISGIGVTASEKKTFLCEGDWQELLNHQEKIVQINGHFACLTVSNNQISLFTDPIGLRDIYYSKLNQDEIIFSSRIDLLLKFVNTELDYSVFGGRWLLYNQVSHKSIFKNIERIVCGTTLTIDRKTRAFTEKYFNWYPGITKENYSESDFENELTSIINVYSESMNDRSLMLSGGLDSRVLLSLLNKFGTTPFSIYTFGNDEHPDIKIAKKITSYYGLTHSIIDHNKFYPEDFWEELKTYSTQTLVNNSVTSFLHFRAYEAFKQLNGIIIDGGFGEIWRREFLYRLSLKGKDKITAKDIRNIMPHLRLHRADIFNADIIKEMEKGCIEQIDEVFDLLPSPQNIGIENWLDLLAIKTRLPNYYLHEQSRHDSMFTSFMPFTQQSLLRNLFNVDLNQRMNGKLFRSVIRRNDIKLTNFPLVKGEVVLPFDITSFQSRLISLLLKKAGAGKKNRDQRLKNLRRLKPLILDLLKNESVVKSELYDRKKLDKFEQLVNKDIGEVRLWNEIDWWLAFESLRQSINLN